MGEPFFIWVSKMIDEIYNKDVLRLAANISRVEQIADANVSVSLSSPLCGSTITVLLQIEEGEIVNFSQEIKACALGQASASVLAKNVIGMAEKDIRQRRSQLERMLKDNHPPPGGKWAELSALKAAMNAKPRHAAILLPFDAVLQGFKKHL